MPRRPSSLPGHLRTACAALLMGLVALPDPALASSPSPSGRSLDAMSDAELERFVQQLNESANWRKYRRPGDPPDFVPGKPVKVMFGAGAAFGRTGGMRAGGGAFRRGGLGARRSGLSNRRRNSRDQASSSGIGSSSRSRGGSSQSSFGGGSRNGGNGTSNFGTSMNQGAFGEN